MIDFLQLFSSNSANDEYNKHLWVKGASLFIPQLNNLLGHTDYKFNIIDIEEFNNDSELLGTVLSKHGSDKSTSHNYHILYSYIFNQLGKDNSLNVLEIGLGTNNPALLSTMGVNGRPGASLYAFREYLPNANIYGGDIDKDILFEYDRIKTFWVDQLELKSFEMITQSVGDVKFDLIIDDGLHSIGANFNTLLFALNHINEKGWIVIEDIHLIENWRVIDFILASTNKFKTYVLHSKAANMYVVHKM